MLNGRHKPFRDRRSLIWTLYRKKKTLCCVICLGLVKAHSGQPPLAVTKLKSPVRAARMRCLKGSSQGVYRDAHSALCDPFLFFSLTLRTIIGEEGLGRGGGHI